MQNESHVEDHTMDTIIYKGDGRTDWVPTVNKAFAEYIPGDVIASEGSLWTPLLNQYVDTDLDMRYDTTRGIAYCETHGYRLDQLARTFASLVRRAIKRRDGISKVPMSNTATICEFVGANDLIIQALELMGDSYKGGDSEQRTLTEMAWDHAYQNDYWQDRAIEEGRLE